MDLFPATPTNLPPLIVARRRYEKAQAECDKQETVCGQSTEEAMDELDSAGLALETAEKEELKRMKR